MNTDLQHIINAAHAGGKVLREYFGQSLVTTQKSAARDFKTKADTESEAVIISMLEAAFPTYSIVSEECGMVDKGSEYTFYIDPLDGTYNFVLGIPQFSVSIALYKNKQALMGVVYHPILNNTYSAMRGEGAFLNSVPIRVSTEATLPKATISFSCGYGMGHYYQTHCQDMLYRKGCGRVIIMWSPALDMSLISSGKVEAIIMHKAELYDFAAGKIIAREAGARITDFEGRPETDDINNEFIISNGTAVHDEVAKVVREIQPMHSKLLEQKVVVIALIKDEQGKVLLQQRNDTTVPEAHGKWELPGGGVDEGESPEEALRRECKEELGITIAVEGLVPLSQSHVLRMQQSPSVATFVVCYKARIIEGVPTPSDAEVAQVGWYAHDELPGVDFLLGVDDFIKAA